MSKLSIPAPRLLPMAATLLAMLAACSSIPTANADLAQARIDYRQAQNDEPTRVYASTELRQAGEALERANAAWERDDNAAEVNHLAYLSKQSTALAQADGRQRAAEMSVNNANAEREKMRLDARTNEADAAKVAAATAQGQALDAQRQTLNAEQQAEQARQQSQDAQVRNAQLESQLLELNARQTDHGMVITLSDVLFDTNRSVLKPQSMRAFEKLVGFMKQYPQRQAAVDGYTDSVGSTHENQLLSGRRADAVRTALVDMGVSGDRLVTRAYGEAYPVADNGSAEGRQLNRRVEIVLSDDKGVIQQR